MAFSTRLVTLCGLCLLVFGWTVSVDFVSENMKEDLQKIKEHFKTSDKALFSSPVFLKELNDLESKFDEGEQKLLLGEVLNVYLRILHHMMNSTEDDDVKRSLRQTRNRVDSLKKHYFQGKGHLRAHLEELWAIKVEDSLVQRKAMRELMPVFHKASTLGNRNHSSKDHFRKRRQARSGRV